MPTSLQIVDVGLMDVVQDVTGWADFVMVTGAQESQQVIVVIAGTGKGEAVAMGHWQISVYSTT
jgi:hypothetical protein